MTRAYEPGKGRRRAASEATEAWSVFACPVTQVMKFHESVEARAPRNPANRSFRYQTRSQTAKLVAQEGRLRVTVYNPMADKQLRLGFIFSKNGVPSFECFQPFDAHPPADGPVSINDIVPPGLCAGCKAESGTRPRPRDQLHDAWRDVQDAMARFGCIADMRAIPGTTWADVGPSISASRPHQRPPAIERTKTVRKRVVLQARTMNRSHALMQKVQVRPKLDQH